MRIKVRVFGNLREMAGAAEMEIDLPDGAAVVDAIGASGLEDRVDVWVLVDGSRAGRGELLRDGAEIVFFQPVGGG